MTNKNKAKNTNFFKTNESIISYIVIASIFVFSMLIPIIAATSQSYITSYGDDIAWLSWGQKHHTNALDILNGAIGTGYRPVQSIIFFIGYNLFGAEPFYYYILDGLFLAGAMIFLFLLGKTLHSQLAGIIAVLLYLFLDGTFIMVSKLNFIIFSAEIFFITSAIYFSITYFNTKTKSSMILAIILSTLAFGSKEPSIVIIPAVNLTYLYFNKMLNRNLIIIHLLPLIYLFISVVYLAPSSFVDSSTSVTEHTLSNLQFYIDTEITSQFKSPILLLFSILIAGYYIFRNKLRTELMLCVSWIIVGVTPLLFTKIAVQPTYLIEANLGMVLLIGIVIADRFKTNDIILGLLILAILSQLLVVPYQVAAMKGYNIAVSENQRTFFETVDGLNELSPSTKVFYFSDSVRQKHGGMQLTEGFFQDYLCLRKMCTLTVVTNYSEANIIVLPSSLDVSIFQKEINETNLSILKQIKYGENYGFVLQKIH